MVEEEEISAGCKQLNEGNKQGAGFAEFQKRVKVVGMYVNLKTCSGSQKSLKIIIVVYC